MNHKTSLQNIFLTFYSQNGLKLLWCVRQIAILIHNFSSHDKTTLCYLQTQLSTFSASWPGAPSEEVGGALSVYMLALTRSSLTTTSTGIFVYHFTYNFRWGPAYLHRCISDWRLGQRSICNTSTCRIIQITPITNGITITFIFHWVFFSFIVRCNLSFVFLQFFLGMI